MEATQEKKPIDRTGWGPGPWDGEPDRLEWRTAAGLPALARRAGHGSWCGYVAVPPGHPLHGAHYDDPPVDVHGGLTYAAACDGEICHVPGPGEPDDVWWFGFDCAHAGDLMPMMLVAARAMPRQLRTHDSTDAYRTLAYVQEQCEQLAVQLRAQAVAP